MNESLRIINPAFFQSAKPSACNRTYHPRHRIACYKVSPFTLFDSIDQYDSHSPGKPNMLVPPWFTTVDTWVVDRFPEPGCCIVRQHHTPRHSKSCSRIEEKLPPSRTSDTRIFCTTLASVSSMHGPSVSHLRTTVVIQKKNKNDAATTQDPTCGAAGHAALQASGSTRVESTCPARPFGASSSALSLVMLRVYRAHRACKFSMEVMPVERHGSRLTTRVRAPMPLSLRSRTPKMTASGWHAGAPRCAISMTRVPRQPRSLRLIQSNIHQDVRPDRYLTCACRSPATQSAEAALRRPPTADSCAHGGDYDVESNPSRCLGNRRGTQETCRGYFMDVVGMRRAAAQGNIVGVYKLVGSVLLL
ncbi:hypothetical protein A0H81_09457 [Grifola frondosa]|uniref:Uncharacterized protein n=1 Tax=Grifola frondosa TaxID=5627 RepID=A0A1C7M1N1_GRIFR|nr:hypothetical protein A0H81_09457 [Grifola frondosa]